MTASKHVCGQQHGKYTQQDVAYTEQQDSMAMSGGLMWVDDCCPWSLTAEWHIFFSDVGDREAVGQPDIQCLGPICATSRTNSNA